MLSKLILLGSGSIALITGAYVIEAPTAAAPVKTVTTAQTGTATPVMNPLAPDHTVPLIYSPYVIPAPATVAPAPAPAPAPTVTDPNAGIITIPTSPPPTTAPAPTPAGCASLTNPAWTASSPVNLPDTICTATKTCDSLLKPADDTSNDFPTLTAGQRYYLTPRTDGVTLPDGVSGPAVVAVPASGAIPTTMNQVFSASCFQ